MSAKPFDQLLGLVPQRLPKSGKSTLVVDGAVVTDARKLADLEERDKDAALRALERARDQAKYQRQRQDPVAMAKRAEWTENNREKVRIYKKDWDAKNIERNRQLKRESARRKYRNNPAAAQAASRSYYERNREKILAKLQEERDAKRAAKTGGAT